MCRIWRRETFSDESRMLCFQAVVDSLVGGHSRCIAGGRLQGLFDRCSPRRRSHWSKQIPDIRVIAMALQVDSKVYGDLFQKRREPLKERVIKQCLHVIARWFLEEFLRSAQSFWNRGFVVVSTL